jgi:hypothetical protein
MPEADPPLADRVDFSAIGDSAIGGVVKAKALSYNYGLLQAYEKNWNSFGDYLLSL